MPEALRVPALVLLVALGGYFGLCFHHALGKNPSGFSKAHPYLLWFGGWQMFTTRDRTHNVMEAHALADGAWISVDLATLFPARWESGPRYARRVFRDSPSRMRVLAWSTCRRMEASPELPDPAVLLFEDVSWRKRLGTVDQAPQDAQRRKLLMWDCGEKISRPKGVRI